MTTMTMKNKFDFIKKYLRLYGTEAYIIYHWGLIKVAGKEICDLEGHWYTTDFSFVKKLMFPYKGRKYRPYDFEYQRGITKSILRHKGWYLKDVKTYVETSEEGEKDYCYEYTFGDKRTGNEYVFETVIDDTLQAFEEFIK